MSDIDLDLQSELRSAFVRADTGDWESVCRRATRRGRLRTVRVAAIVLAATLVVVTQALGVSPGVGSLFGTRAPRVVKAGFADAFVGKGVDESTIRLGSQVRMQTGSELRLWTARRSAHGDTCIQFEVGGRSAGLVGCGMTRPGTVGTYIFGAASPPASTTQHEVIAIGGVAPAAAARVRLGFADGSTLVLKTTRGAWAAEITAAQRREGHNLVFIEPLNSRGKPIAAGRIVGPPLSPSAAST